MKGLRERLQRRFSPSLFLRRADGLVQVGEGGGAHEWIVARELCAYTVLDAHAIPAGKRRGFADTAVRRWSPFQDPQSHLEWAGDHAMAWAWSKGRVLGDAGVEGRAPVATQPRRLLPESLFRGEPHASGEELLAMDHGIEGRVWREHRLAASEWWPAPPGLGEWNQFLRGAGIAPMASLPVVRETDLSESPWNAHRPRDLGELARRHQGLLAAVALGLGVAVLTTSLVAALALAVSIGQVENQIAAQDEGLQQILAAREQAGRDADAIESLLSLRPRASQLALVAEAGKLLPAGGELLEWRMPDPGTLELDLRLPQADPPALVASWEASPRFEAVTVDMLQDADEIGIRTRVVPVAPAGAAP